ncbi:uncharacterized protein BDV17DRAFT_151310 [Aspergillus undulatus]|uniref:uncharacterized protein n=1 Tax=Aspergillus undulatus TaxID=1810928 RepID=UPI003CCD4AA5
MANSTHPGHFHVPDSDGAIILMLGGLVFVTFALGLVSQLCEKSIPLFSFLSPRKQYYENEYEYGIGDTGINHKMADLEAGMSAAATAAHSLPPPSTSSGGEEQPTRPHLPRRSTTRYGSIIQHVLDVHGVRKMVLVVDTDAGNNLDRDNDGRDAAGQSRSPDEYAEWYARWRQYQSHIEAERQREQEYEAEIEGLDESAPLLGPWD